MLHEKKQVCFLYAHRFFQDPLAILSIHSLLPPYHSEKYTNKATPTSSPLDTWTHVSVTGVSQPHHLASQPQFSDASKNMIHCSKQWVYWIHFYKTPRCKKEQGLLWEKWRKSVISMVSFKSHSLPLLHALSHLFFLQVKKKKSLRSS